MRLDQLGDWRRTDYCGAPRPTDIGRGVTVMGWVHSRRDHGGVVFVDLRDRTGLLQVVFNPEHNPIAHQRAGDLRGEYVIAVRGAVRARPAETVNPNLATGAVEVMADEVRVLNEALTPPFPIDDETDVAEATRLKYRYLDLRRPSAQQNLTFRHRLTATIRTYLDEQGFVDVETPMLTRSTPEGARDYLVPSRVNRGSFYALPQSPQLFKQILMVAGLDRYYQIAKCFRDEDLRADRQPEFTQIDIEASFVQPEDIYRLIEGMLDKALALKGIAPPKPFPRLTWAEAMRRFGSDKPDLRFGLELAEVTDIVRTAELRVFREAAERGGVVKALAIPDGDRLSRKDLDTLPDAVATYGAKGVAWARLTGEGWQSPIAKFLGAEQRSAIERATGAGLGGVILFLADSAKVANDSLCHLRLKLGAQLGMIPSGAHAFLWVTEFPLFEHSAEEGRAMSVNHPFTAPMDEDLERLESDPYSVRAKAYDVVWNGLELGGGSIRIHRADVQSRVFTQLGMSAEEARARFGFLLDALAYGAPPHGGIALGLDRMAMLLCGAGSLRDVIAFPKTQRATCLMTEAPSPVDTRQLRELGIRVAE
jgi:aspartyl-tRNA synthetase